MVQDNQLTHQSEVSQQEIDCTAKSLCCCTAFYYKSFRVEITTVSTELTGRAFVGLLISTEYKQIFKECVALHFIILIITIGLHKIISVALYSTLNASYAIDESLVAK